MINELPSRDLKSLKGLKVAESSDNLHGPEAALQQIHTLMSDLLTGSEHRSSLFLSSLDPGMGKSTAVCNFLSSWKDAGFHPSGGVLIALSRHDEIRSYIDRAALSPSDFAVIVANGDPLNDKGLSDPDAARVLFTTHEMLRRLTTSRSFADVERFQYLGRPRALRIWDESLLPARPVTVRLDVLKALPETLRPIDPQAAEGLDALTAAVESTSDGKALKVPEVLSRPTSALAALTGTQRDAWSNAVSLVGKDAMVLQDNRVGKVLVAASSPLPADFAPAIILDASGRVRETYRVMEESGYPLVRLPAAVTDYSRLALHHWDRASSRSALRDPSARKEILEAAAKVINANSDEDWLILHHQPRQGETALEELKALVANPTRLRFVNWGNHHGTNAHRMIRKVMVLSLWHLSEAAYTAHHMAYASGESRLARLS